MPTFFTPDGFSSPEFDQLADQQLVTLDDGQRAQLLAQMQDIVAEQLVVLPLHYADQFFVFRKEVFDRWYYTGRLPLRHRIQQAGVHHRPEDRHRHSTHQVAA